MRKYIVLFLALFAFAALVNAEDNTATPTPSPTLTSALQADVKTIVEAITVKHAEHPSMVRKAYEDGDVEVEFVTKGRRYLILIIPKEDVLFSSQ